MGDMETITASALFAATADAPVDAGTAGGGSLPLALVLIVVIGLAGYAYSRVPATTRRKVSRKVGVGGRSRLSSLQASTIDQMLDQLEDERSMDGNYSCIKAILVTGHPDDVDLINRRRTHFLNECLERAVNTGADHTPSVRLTLTEGKQSAGVVDVKVVTTDRAAGHEPDDDIDGSWATTPAGPTLDPDDAMMTVPFDEAGETVDIDDIMIGGHRDTPAPKWVLDTPEDGQQPASLPIHCGRGSGNDWRIRDMAVSRSAFTVTGDGNGGAILTMNESAKHPLTIDGTTVVAGGTVPLHDGSVVAIGDRRLGTIHTSAA